MEVVVVAAAKVAEVAEVAEVLASRSALGRQRTGR
jgi:hypothetical protein